MGNLQGSEMVPFLGEVGAPIAVGEQRGEQLLSKESLELFSVPRSIISGGFKRLNPTVNKDYFKLRHTNSLNSKIPGVDASVPGTWNMKGSPVQNPYDDYNLSYQYWNDDSWNTHSSNGLIDIWQYSA